ncbi:hypothetical protein [Novosphingobium sp.]|uniref:hypothetical protein n=1 Tax=Novosphingobium sp. TaxID=1874826 RepID=UPI0027334CE9|nr:hypothetical protein [Novosphingobium sp.]MDP3907526.1 hypothetical protein [Novosphingobium sp.]
MLTRADWRGEWLIVRRHPLIWIVASLAIAIVALAAGNDAAGNKRELLESLLRLNLFIPAFVLPFVAGALAPVFYLREVDHGVSELFAAYPQTPRVWLATRSGSFAAMLVLICAFQQVAIVGILASDRPEYLAMLTKQALKLVALVHLPASLIWASVLAWVSCAKGRSGMVYLAATFGWLAYTALATLTGTPLIAGSYVAWEPLRSALLLADPYAITALVNPPPPDALPHSREIFVIVGRIGWLGLCFLLLHGIAAIPALAPARKGSAKRAGLSLPGLTNRSGRTGNLALLLRWTMLDKFFLLALTGWALLVFPEVYSGMKYAEEFSILIPDSRDALNRVMWDLVPAMGALLLLHVADRTGRIGRVTGMAELTAATPHTSWRFFWDQLVCLWLVALTVIAYTLLLVFGAQLAADSSVQPREYLEQGGQALPGLLLSAAAFAALHAALRSRMAANLMGFGLLVLGHSNLAPAMGLVHPLWKPLALHLTSPDHVLGLAGNWAMLLPYALFWSAICMFAVILAVRVHHRGLPYGQVSLRNALFHPATILASAALAGGAWQGLAIHRAVESDFALVSAEQKAQRRADYERRFGEWRERPQPHIAAVRTSVDFSSDGRSAGLQMELKLVNGTNARIEHVLVGRNLIDVSSKVTLESGTAELQDLTTGQTLFRLASPMHPGEIRTLHYSARVARSALADTRSMLILRRQFGSIPAFQITPVIGFERELTLRDPALRRQFGLPVLALNPPSRLGRAGVDLARHEAQLETIVSVQRGRYGLAPGELVRRWEAGDRSYFHFRTDRAIRNLPMFFALAWAPQRWSAGALQVEIHAPESIAQDDPNLLGMRDTLTWLDREVAPFPGRTLRLIAAPEFGPSGFAVPQAMLISHRRGFRPKSSLNAGFDQTYRRAVHETAHQWFGHLIGYGIPEERAFLIESLAKYAELVMIERRYGAKAVQALVAWEADRLAHARLVPAEAVTPLIDAQDTEDMYSRATLTFACLRERLGDRPIDSALFEIAAYARQTGRPARSLDFVLALKRAGGKESEPLVDMLLTGNLSIEVALARSGCNLGQ